MRDDQTFEQRLNDALKRNQMDLTGDQPILLPEESDSFGDASSGLAYGMRLGVEFLSGTIVGFLMGWGIDSYFNTSPWFILIFTLLGFCAGMMNVYRDINQLQDSIGINRRNVLTKGLESSTQQATD